MLGKCESMEERLARWRKAKQETKLQSGLQLPCSKKDVTDRNALQIITNRSTSLGKGAQTKAKGSPPGQTTKQKSIMDKQKVLQVQKQDKRANRPTGNLSACMQYVSHLSTPESKGATVMEEETIKATGEIVDGKPCSVGTQTNDRLEKQKESANGIDRAKGLVDFMLLLEGTCFYGPESSGTIADNDTRALRRSTILEMAAPPMYSKEMRKTNKEDLQKALKMHSGNATILEVEKSASEEEQNSRDEIRQLKEGLSMALEEHAVLHFHNEVLQQMLAEQLNDIETLKQQHSQEVQKLNNAATEYHNQTDNMIEALKRQLRSGLQTAVERSQQLEEELEAERAKRIAIEEDLGTLQDKIIASI